LLIVGGGKPGLSQVGHTQGHGELSHARSLRANILTWPRWRGVGRAQCHSWRSLLADHVPAQRARALREDRCVQLVPRFAVMPTSGRTAPIARCWHAPPCAGQIATTPAVRFLPVQPLRALAPDVCWPGSRTSLHFPWTLGPCEPRRTTRSRTFFIFAIGLGRRWRAGNMVWFWTPQNGARQAGRPTPP
jgi:hypothetical protein